MCLAVPGEVLGIEGDDPLMREGRIAFGGIVKRVCLAYVPEVDIGDFVLVHAGFAIAVVDEEEALRTLSLFEEIAAEGGP